MSKTQPSLLIEHQGPIAIVTLNRPDKRNALSEALNAKAQNRQKIKIGHAAGIIEIEVVVEGQGSARLTRAALGRTARRRMDGYVYVRNDIYSQHTGTVGN